MSKNPLYGLIIGHCTVSSGNRMVSTFQLREFFAIFGKKLQIFSRFLKIFVGFQVYQASKDQEPPLRFDDRLLYSF